MTRERRVVRDFPDPGSAQEIMRILDELPDTIHYSRDPLDRERIRTAIIILAGRKVGRFLQAVEGAKIDWRDVLVAAGLGNEDWPARLDEALGPDDAGHRAAQEEQMTEIVAVPDPEPEWEQALQYQGGKRNPAQQYFTFEEAMGRYRNLAGLKTNIADIARRLRLMLEPGHSDQLGPVDAAFFSIRRTGFAIYRYGTDEHTLLSVFREHEIDPVEAVDVLLEALGVDWRVVATIAFGEGRDRRYIEPVLDAQLRPTFPATA